MWKAVCKMKCLEDGLQFNLSDGPFSSINLIPSDVF